MLDHIGIGVRSLSVSRTFYEQALAPLGYSLLLEFPHALGFGMDGKPDFWLGLVSDHPTRVHVAFRTRDRSVVDAFHESGLAAGGTDHGAPGIREIYHPHYYGAFVLDPDGHNIEAVCHEAM
jgi:catechol 2,3-dioxygenase-like lactoylglutathione lyase family enzyme